MKIARGHGAIGRFCFGLLVTAQIGAAQQSYQCNAQCQKVKAKIEAIANQLNYMSGELQELLPYFDSPDDSLPEIDPPTPTTVPETSSTAVPDTPTDIYPPEKPTEEYPSTTSSISTPSSTSSTPSAPSKSPMSGYPPSNGYRSIAYFTNWGIYGRGYTPDKVPVNKLTHILYAFGDNREDGTVFLTDTWSDIEKHWPGDSWNDVGNNMYGNLKQLNLMKKKNRNLKVLLSIGGWTYTNTNKHMDIPASTSAGRKKFADSCVTLIKDLGFDGIDLDWEYPQSPEQGEQMLLLLQEIRTAMDAYADHLVKDHGAKERPHFELSIASSAGKSIYKNYPLDRLAPVLDFINLMAYDFSGSWDKNVGHQANLYASKDCTACTPFDAANVIKDYMSSGVPSNKIVLGMPLYGRAFENTDGPGQPYQGLGDGDWEKGIYDYKNLPKPGAKVYLDEAVGASYSYDNATRTLISYDTPEMAIRKARFIQQTNLGGAMWWELNGDSPDESKSLISNVVRTLGGSDGRGLEYAPNWLFYPDSQYENLKKGFPTN